MLGTDVAGLAAGPFVAACSLLAIAGIGKITNPRPAREAVAAAGLRLPRAAVAGFGTLELVAGVTGIAIGRAAALAVAACYLVLTAFAWRLLRRAPATPCACLGSSSAPVSRVHVIVNVAAVGTAIAAASGGSPLAPLTDHPFAGVLFVTLVGCCVELVALAFDALPALHRAVVHGVTKETAS